MNVDVSQGAKRELKSNIGLERMKSIILMRSSGVPNQEEHDDIPLEDDLLQEDMLTDRLPFNQNYFNLFVDFSETYEKPFFIPIPDRILESAYTSKHIADNFIKDGLINTELVCSLPSLFLQEEQAQSVDKRAYFGRVTKLQDSSIGIKEFFEKMAEIPIDRIKELVDYLDIGFGELNRTHWAIKNADLIEELDLSSTGSRIKKT